MLIHYYLIIIGRRRGAAAGGAERGGATICTDQVSGQCPRVDAAFEAGQWSRRPRLKRGCLPPAAAQAGGGGETSCSSEREQAPPCPVCNAGRWSCHLRVVLETTTPQLGLLFGKSRHNGTGWLFSPSPLLALSMSCALCPTPFAQQHLKLLGPPNSGRSVAVGVAEWAPSLKKGDGRLRPSLQQRLPGAEGPPEGCTTAPRHAACGGPLSSQLR